MRPLRTRTTCVMGKSSVLPAARERVTRRQVMMTVSLSVKKRVVLNLEPVERPAHLLGPLLVSGVAAELAAPRQVGRLVQHHVGVERGRHVGEAGACITASRVHVGRFRRIEAFDDIARRRRAGRAHSATSLPSGSLW